MIKATFFLLINVLALHANLLGQQQFLVLSKTIWSEMTPQKPDSFYLKMNKGQFASIRVTEKNIRLCAQIFDPSDSLIMIVDENQLGNKEIISIFSEKFGDYKIKVLWGFIKPLSGKYSITLDKLEAAGRTPEQKAAQLFDGWYEGDAPGGAVLVMRGNQVLFKRTKGLANMEENISIKNNSVFELASCSKQFTGLAVAMLVDKGLISLRDDIRNYIPEIPDYGSKITIGNLVYQTSGIRSTDDMQFAGYTPEDITTLPMCIKFAIDQENLKFTPGERYNYSNTNYNLLAEIIARVTKQSFASWTKENIFKPLEMNSTFFKEDPGQIYSNKVLCYTGIQSGFRQRPNNWAATGASGLCTTLEDLEKWVIGFNTLKLVNHNVLKLLETKGVLNNGSTVNYSFGNEIKEVNGREEIIHLGLVVGFRIATIRYPEQEMAFICLSNDDNDATFQRYPKIVDLFINGNLRKGNPSLKGVPNANEVLKKFEDADKFAESIDLSPYAGTYYSKELSCVWQIEIKKSRLVIESSRIQDVNLKYSGGDKFGFIEFTRDSANSIVGIRILGEGIEFLKKSGRN